MALIPCDCICHKRPGMIHCNPCCYNGLSDTDNPLHWAYGETGPPAVDNIELRREQKLMAYGRQGQEYYPSAETIQKIGEIFSARAAYLLAEYEFQEFIADR